jgi:hypothetical protein
VQRLLGNHRVGDLELDVADGLVAQRTLARAPLEALRWVVGRAVVVWLVVDWLLVLLLVVVVG